MDGRDLTRAQADRLTGHKPRKFKCNIEDGVGFYAGDPRARKLKRGWHVEHHIHGKTKSSATLHVRNGFHAVACTGEAHGNAFIDNCSMCAPMWGWRAIADAR